MGVSDHPPENDLNAYIDRALEPLRRTELEAHLKSCPLCANDLARLRQLFQTIESLPEEVVSRDLAPEVLEAIRSSPSWVPSLAVGEFIAALGVGAVLILGFGTSGVLVGLSAASGRLAMQIEAVAMRIAVGWGQVLDQLSTFEFPRELGLPDLVSTGMWSSIAVAGVISWLIGNGLVLRLIRREA